MKRALVAFPPFPNNNPLRQDDMITEKTTSHHQQDPIHLFLSASLQASKRRRVAEVTGLEDSNSGTPMEISSYDNDEGMDSSTEYHYYLLDLPTEMLAHIFSFLPLPELCRSAGICTSTYAVVRFYTLSVCTTSPLVFHLLLFISTYYHPPMLLSVINILLIHHI